MIEEDAAHSIRRFMIMMKGLAELAPELTTLASVKQARSEVEAANGRLRAEGEALKAKVEDLRLASAKLTADGEATKARIQTELEAEIDRNKIEANRIILDAQAKADRIRAVAKAEHEKLQAKIVEKQKTLELIQAEAVEAEGRYEAIKKDVIEMLKRVS